MYDRYIACEFFCTECLGICGWDQPISTGQYNPVSLAGHIQYHRSEADYETPVIQTVNVTEGANPEIDFIPEPAPPVAGFVVNTTSVTATQDLAFTDHSTGLISSWLWDFGDGITSTEQTPTHNYIATGIYNVSLVLTNPSGSSTRVRTSYVTVVDSPDARLQCQCDLRCGSAFRRLY